MYIPQENSFLLLSLVFLLFFTVIITIIIIISQVLYLITAHCTFIPKQPFSASALEASKHNE